MKNAGLVAADGEARTEVAYDVVRTSRAFEEVISQLRRHTLQGQLRPGDRLPSERDLAERLGVSRNTVREALRCLEMSGVIKLHKGVQGGAFLVAPNGNIVATGLQDMFQLGSVTPAQLTEARLHITASVVKLVCEKIDDAGVQRLEANVKEAQQASEAGNLVRRSHVNLEFHKILAELSGNPIMVAIMNGVIAIMERFVETLGPPMSGSVFPSRARFLAHVRKRDAGAATAEMEKYLKLVHREYLSRVDTMAGPLQALGPAPAPAKRVAKARK
ncbi:MAG: GntR family transcriptional regulator [Pseudomonadota bacterium]